MTAIYGVEDIVNAPSMFDMRPRGPFGEVFARGVRNFYDHVTLTVVGAAMVAGVNATQAPVPRHAGASFTEPASVAEADREWRSSLASFADLIQRMRAGARPAHADALSLMATRTLASVADRKDENVEGWAKALASEDADLDD